MRVPRPVIAAAASVALVLGASVAPAAAASAPGDGFDRTARSLTDPASTWVIVNKVHPLKPRSYAPADLVTVPVPHANPVKLRKPAASALVRMFRAYTKATGKRMQSQSAYRSYSAQVSTYNGWVARLGRKGADLTSARPGFSEHQTGLAIDISAVGGTCTLRACFASTSQGKWLAKNAWRYGFILRYAKDKTKVTGYEFEPWHFRYVGGALAREMRATGVKTLEEFFGYRKAPDYR
ncbi:M15 family metallopeptidase [Galbitalea sp. SE-J8]|uniref:M15 family metallopeptidase n=1 Tax=Galbitalea sp. SE-J8 TaxID=3054952 RepID=UPI00259C77A7|nr:M15 family metallopeptidase [Galbitalea sp. SE-J8]MDM4763878.1 M15 family metallopeptidase [Galbitalea sp. SE-J8]